MLLSEYQERAGDSDNCGHIGLIYYGLGITGEAGEVAEKLKKVFRDAAGVVTDEKRDEFKKELGDVLWYVARLSYHLGLDLDDVATTNIAKLASRMERNTLGGEGDNR